jgi:amidase
MARDVAGLVVGMELLEPGFAPAGAVDTTVGRLRLAAHPDIDAAIDRALHEAELDVVDIELPQWHEILHAALAILDAEAWAVDGPLLAAYPDGVSAEVAERLRKGATMTAADVAAARVVQAAWQSTLAALQAEAGVAFFALPTLADFPPPLDHADRMRSIRYTLAVNLAGVPALALPVPTGGPLPASLQLVGPAGSEEELLAYGRLIERAS